MNQKDNIIRDNIISTITMVSIISSLCCVIIIMINTMITQHIAEMIANPQCVNVSFSFYSWEKMSAIYYIVYFYYNISSNSSFSISL